MRAMQIAMSAAKFVKGFGALLVLIAVLLVARVAWGYASLGSPVGATLSAVAHTAAMMSFLWIPGVAFLFGRAKWARIGWIVIGCLLAYCLMAFTFSYGNMTPGNILFSLGVGGLGVLNFWIFTRPSVKEAIDGERGVQS